MFSVKDAFKKIGSTIQKTVSDVKESLKGDDLKQEQPKNQVELKEMSTFKQPKVNHEAESSDNDLIDYFPLENIQQFDASKLPGRIRNKVEVFQDLLSSNIINEKKLNEACFNGVPDDCPGLRSVAWRLILQQMPPQKAKWETYLNQSRETYKMLVEKYILSVQPPSEEIWDQQDEDESNYYLSNSNEMQVRNPKWVSFFQDRDLWIEVEKDTTRTRAEMHFFVTETRKKDPFINPYKRIKEQAAEKHFDVLSRILFVYAKTNSGIKYVQGMNEILAIIYNVFLSDKQFSEYVEADSFFAFTTVMAEVRDCFIKVLDDSDSGIKSRINEVNQLLKKVDLPLWQALEDMRVNPQFYSLRWLMLIFTQEFEIFDVMRLWDSYLSHSNRQLFMDFICIAILEIQREHLLYDFADAMENLQRIQHLQVIEIVIKADELYRKFNRK